MIMLCARIFACTTVHLRGRCEGSPSVWNEVLYSQRDATKRGGERTERAKGGTDSKRMERKRTTVAPFELFIFKDGSSRPR